MADTPIPRGQRMGQVLAFVRAHLDATNQPPSYGIIARELNMGDRTDVCRVVKRLEASGWLTRAGQGRERRIRMVA